MTINRTGTKNHTRYYELDLLRFIAAMAVVLFHFLFRGQNGDYMPVSFQPFDTYAQYGYLGVPLFFMISGFVILLSATNRSALQFTTSRIARLYPAFWVSVSLSAFVMLIFGQQLFSINLPQYLANLTMLGGFFGVEDIDGVYWTLYLELKFYALIFIVLLFNKIEKIEWIMSTWIVILLLDFFSPLPKSISFFVFPEWAPYFIGGASFYLLKMKGANLQRIINLLIAFCLSLYMGAEGVVELNTAYQVAALPIVAIITIFLFYIIFALIIFDKLSWFRSKWAMSIGALTYPLYLIHQNIGYIAFSHFYKDVNKYLLLFAVITVLLIISWLISAKIETKLGPFIKQNLDKLLHNHSDNTPASAR